jgi:hypothetical protein|tara:strand:- start:697 stop:930 length:234 start_codon:yes stop_codon:yes gene_type:complete
MINEDRKLILLSDVIETKVRKENELKFYEAEVRKLEEKLVWIRRDLNINNIIIDMIKNETVIDIKETMEKQLLEKGN